MDMDDKTNLLKKIQGLESAKNSFKIMCFPQKEKVSNFNIKFVD